MLVQHYPCPGNMWWGCSTHWRRVNKPSRHLWMPGIMRKILRSSPVKISLQLFRSTCGRKGFFWRIIHYLQITTDEGSLGDLLLAAARQGSHIIAIYVPQREHIDHMSAILFNHGARFVKYIGNWSVEDLFPPIKSGKGGSA